MNSIPPVKTPAISIIMPIFNVGGYLESAIASILSQTFTNFELLCLNDSSTDNSLDVIKSFHDSRIIPIENEQNLGISKTLNKGIKLSRGDYIARMDSDDISLSCRLQKQYDFMQANADVGVCGSYVKTIGPLINRVYKFPQTHEQIACDMLLRCPFAHPSVMFRKSVLLQHQAFYAEDHKAEDYELYSRLVTKTKMHNLPEVLLRYRKHPGQITQGKISKHLQDSASVAASLIQQTGISLDQNQLTLLSQMGQRIKSRSNKDLETIHGLLLNLKQHNQQTQQFNQQIFNNFLSTCWRTVCKNSTHLGIANMLWLWGVSSKYQQLTTILTP